MYAGSILFYRFDGVLIVGTLPLIDPVPDPNLVAKGVA
jgi:hypothetical protein